ncbi:MAG: protein-disulfide reductase DsbD domain-containing protein [Rhodoblastus sp.]|uniref:protein-disulfide reductase DsbD domain-containing protein n=2 Tax=Rhodoblastus sp. TaxID=1962975 RepID=UPI003F99DC25
MRAQSEAATPVNFRNALAGALVALAALSAPAARAEWVSSAKSQARLIDGGVIDGLRYAGVQIRLDGAAVTYWRDPGEAGAAPTFDFAGSENLGEAKVLFPQPARIDEDGVVAFGYQHEVLFPVRIAWRQKGQPVVLDLSLDYAVCEAICLPVHAQMRLDLPSEPQTGAEARALLAGALQKIPQPLDAEQTKLFARVSPVAGENDKPQWLLRLLQGEAENIFVEPPPGFYVETRAAGEKNAFVLTLAEHPAKKPTLDAPIRVTVAGSAPIEFDLALPQGRP